MSYSEYNQQNPQFGQAFGNGGFAGQGWGQGLGHAAFGQQGFGGWQQGGGWQPGGFGAPWQRQVSQQDVGEIVRHLVPLLPLIINQAQQPHAAFGYGYGSGIGGGFGGGFGQRNLSQQDVHEVVRHLLPVLPQIVGLLQGQQGQFGNAIFGGQGWGGGQGGYGQNPWGQAAFGNIGNVGNAWGGQRLNQADVGEIVRHLTAVLPQVISNLQACNQQQRAA